MATLLQKKLAQEIVKDVKRGKLRNKKELVVSSGYSEISAKSSAHLILESDGVKEELENLGFTVEGADGVVKEILYKGKREENRLKAAGMVYERLGANVDKGGNKTLIVFVSGESAKRYGTHTTSPSTVDHSE